MREEIEAITPIHDESPEENFDGAEEVHAGEEHNGDSDSSTVEPNTDNDKPIEVDSTATETEESVKNTPKATQQAEALKAALRRAQATQKGAGKPQANRQGMQAKKPVGDKVDDKRRTMLLGKKATRTITADNGEVVVNEGAEITEEVLHRARIANKYIELSMNYTA